MRKPLVYGSPVMDHVTKRHPESKRTIIVIRHSERPTFDGIPSEEWDHVLLNENGIKTAKEMGRAIAETIPTEKIRVFHWGFARTSQTADAIVEGAEEMGKKVKSRRTLDLLPPVADRSAYLAIMKAGGGREMFRLWLTGGGHDAMVPVSDFGTKVFSELLSDRVCGFGEAAVVVTHDIHIYPLLHHVFGKTSVINFLDGIVISTSPELVHIGFGEMSESVHPNRLIAKQ
jgi:phosphohistidine phosphatase SixA